MNFDIRIIINFDYIRYFFIDRSIFIIYIKIQSRFIKGIITLKFNLLFAILLILIIMLMINALF